MIVVQKTIHAWRGTVIVTAMTTAPVPWFVETTTVLGMDLMALMIVVQVNLNNDFLATFRWQLSQPLFSEPGKKSSSSADSDEQVFTLHI